MESIAPAPSHGTSANEREVPEWLRTTPKPPTSKLNEAELQEVVSSIQECLDGASYDPNDESELQSSLEFFSEWRDELAQQIGSAAMTTEVIRNV